MESEVKLKYRNLSGTVDLILKEGKNHIICDFKTGAEKNIQKKNDAIVILPKLKIVEGKVALEDPDTLLNAGAFYLQRGDKVVVRLGVKKGKVWEAEYIERK